MGWDGIMPKTLQDLGERLLFLLDRTGLGFLLHHLLVFRGLALLRIHLLHWARLGLDGARWQIITLSLHLHLVILFFGVGLLVHAGKEVYAMGAYQVDGAIALEVGASPHCQD